MERTEVALLGHRKHNPEMTVKYLIYIYSVKHRSGHRMTGYIMCMKH